MKIRVDFLIVAIIFAGFFQNIFSMEKKSEEKNLLKGNSQESYLKSKTPGENLKSSFQESFGAHPDKKFAPSRNSLLLNTSETGSQGSPPLSPRKGGSPRKDSSRTESPRKSPRKPQHALWFFCQDGISMQQRVDVEFFGIQCLEKLCFQLKLHNAQIFIWITAQDVNILDVDCSHELTERLKQLKIHEEVVHPDTTQEFCDLMKRYYNNNDQACKVIVVYGASNNSKIYEMLACWAIPIMIDHAMDRGDTVLINDEYCSIDHILQCKIQSEVLAKLILEPLANYILQLTYQRVLQNADKLNSYLSEETQANIKKYCLNILEDLGKKY